jgi:hypothetical protein
MGIRTPCYTTTKEQNHIGHMGIRTPCYTTTKEQYHINQPMWLIWFCSFVVV